MTSALEFGLDMLLIKLDRIRDLGDGRYTVPVDKIETVLSWCQDNNISAFSRRKSRPDPSFSASCWDELIFETDAQAVLFKLRWC
jgi:hypothetical protein